MRFGHGLTLRVGPGVDEETAVFNKRTTAWFDPIEQAGWQDASWLVYGAKREFTWHSPGHDNGFRLDQAFVSPELVDRVTDAHHCWVEDVDKATRRDAVSDHAAFDRRIRCNGVRGWPKTARMCSAERPR